MASFSWGFVTPSALRTLVEVVHEDYSDAHIKVTDGGDVLFDCDVRDCLIELKRAS